MLFGALPEAHLDRQLFRWGPDDFTALVHQCEIAMAELEAADCTEMVSTADESPTNLFQNSGCWGSQRSHQKFLQSLRKLS